LEDNLPILNKQQITKKINKLFSLISKIKKNDMKKNVKVIKKFYKSYLELGIGLGYTVDVIKNAYDKKNEVNHTRQENNY
jgi:dimeric dUTPase (all-alpha-NTP-PPase superfamily)